MKFSKYRACGSILAIAMMTAASPAFAADKDGDDKAKPAAQTAWEASRARDDNDMVTTGVARGRDRLDSATSTSSIKESEIVKIAPRSLAELYRNIPGIRVEAPSGEGNNSYTVRGLPLVDQGSKYLQLQEDGLPVLEFGDLIYQAPDIYLRADANVAQVESIRGGSSSTFASNAPGGVINLISKTGEVEGGSIMGTAGLDYQSFRTDFDYGGHLSKNWRFHVGGFYRTGEGPRETGFNAFRGGQIKLNVTRQFDNGGYVRINAKLLDDTFPFYYSVPLGLSGTDANPTYKDVNGFPIISGTLLSPNYPDYLTADENGTVHRTKMRDGDHAKAKSIGLEAQFPLGDWSVSERFRYADQAANLTSTIFLFALPPAALASSFGGPGASLTYATGPRAGTTVDPARDSLLSVAGAFGQPSKDGNITNDIRISRVWNIGAGALTTTAGFYKARQRVAYETTEATVFQTISPRTELVNVTAANGAALSLEGYYMLGLFFGPGYFNKLDLTYNINAPYGSFNYHQGKVSIGGSVRYDNGSVKGVAAADSTTRTADINGDGAISSLVESSARYIGPADYHPIDYGYGYFSYSVGVNYRVSDPFALFARTSRGARAGAVNILFADAIDPVTGKLVNKKAAYDPVNQSEIGLKYRKNGLTFDATGFYATVNETARQIVGTVYASVSRGYKAYGVEFEAGARRGAFSVNAGATLTHAEITSANDSTLIGKTPRHQPKLIFQVTPQYDTDRFTLGANIVGTTDSYAQDVNQLKLPAYTTVGLFAQYRPLKRVEIGVNASNLFNALGITEVSSPTTIPQGGAIGGGRSLYGRTVSASFRYFF